MTYSNEYLTIMLFWNMLYDMKLECQHAMQKLGSRCEGNFCFDIKGAFFVQSHKSLPFSNSDLRKSGLDALGINSTGSINIRDEYLNQPSTFVIFPDHFMVRIIFGFFLYKSVQKVHCSTFFPFLLATAVQLIKMNALEIFYQCRDYEVSLKTQTIGNNVLNAHRHLQTLLRYLNKNRPVKVKRAI